MANPAVAAALRELHKFLLSEEEQFVSRDAFLERKENALGCFYVLHDYLLGEPRGDNDATDKTYRVEWDCDCRITVTVRAQTEEEARRIVAEGSYGAANESLWPSRETGIDTDDMTVTEITQ